MTAAAKARVAPGSCAYEAARLARGAAWLHASAAYAAISTVGAGAARESARAEAALLGACEPQRHDGDVFAGAFE